MKPTLNPQRSTPDPRVQYWEDFFVYNANFVSIAPAAVQNVGIPIQADAVFRWYATTYYADIAGAVFTESAAPVPQCVLQITDSSSNRQLLLNPAPLSTIGGNGQLPFYLPQPREFAPNSNISLQLTNFSTASTYNVRLQLIGAKLMQGGGKALG